MIGGRTAHSRFHISFDGDPKSTCHIEQESKLSEMIHNASFMIGDEAHMAHKHNIEAVDRNLRAILHVKHSYSEDMIFRGISIVNSSIKRS
ncbi:unnamed protein product [Linum trigynum]|uniref:ATP-dependent DNA helicase n=1 Tax=Linum trigynum TaxID=586398 RepID=A0AAV2FW09_9ROSI